MKVTCALILSENKVLIARRPMHKTQGGKWEFPGGKLMEGETAEDCIIREIAEELDLEINVVERLETVTHAYPDFTIELMPLVCRIMEGSITLHEHMAALWADRQMLSTTDLCEADKKVLPLLYRLLP